MLKLSNIGARFEIEVDVIEGGRGKVSGVLTETDQNQVPAYVFVEQRRVFRVRVPSALKLGMVIRTPEGETFIVGDNGYSEIGGQTVWRSFRLYKVTQQLHWQRRIKIVDPVTGLERDNGHEDKGLIWVAVEPLDREVFDRKIRSNVEQARFICGAHVERDDILDGRPVIRSDDELGLRVGILS